MVNDLLTQIGHIFVNDSIGTYDISVNLSRWHIKPHKNSSIFQKNLLQLQYSQGLKTNNFTRRIHQVKQTLT